MLKTDNLVIIKMLEKKIITQPPKNVDVKIVADFFILHPTKQVSRVFGEIAKEILQRITDMPALRLNNILIDKKLPQLTTINTRLEEMLHNGLPPSLVLDS